MTTHFKTYDQVGIKEDISDVISNISPTATPFQTLLKSEKVTNTLFQWQEDSLAAVADNAKVEGFDASDDNMTPTTMRRNYTQIMSKVVKVAATADAVSTYGRAKETAYQLSKKSAELKRDVEFHYVGKAQDAAVGNGTDTARRFGNVFGKDADGVQIIDSSVTVSLYSGAGGTTENALTEAAVLSVGQKMYEAGSEGEYIMVKPGDALVIAGFDKSAGRTRVINDKATAVVNAVDLYVSPFGEQKVIINRWMKETEALVLRPDMWRGVTLRPFTRELLAKTGDSDRHMIVGELSLKHLNYKGTGRITGLSGDSGNLPSDGA
jgi:co-chaperonin GroES (HSP10)